MPDLKNSTPTKTPIALTIAGSDSGGGAGIQADLKAFSAQGVYGASVITAVTAQNTIAVTAVHPIPKDIVRAQMQAVFDDLNITAVKIGMLASPDVIEAVCDGLGDAQRPIVLDPVMVAKSGDKLLQQDAIESLTRLLIPKAVLLTPNLPEAATLLGCEAATDEHTMKRQGVALLGLGASAVLMKGGHAEGKRCIDLLITRNKECIKFEVDRIDTENTHGTGCTLSSAITANLAKGSSVVDAVESAHAYLNLAILAADRINIGRGHGPVHHFHHYW